MAHFHLGRHHRHYHHHYHHQLLIVIMKAMAHCHLGHHHHQLLIVISKGEHLVDQTTASPHQRMILIYLKESSPEDHKSRIKRMTPFWKASAPIVDYKEAAYRGQTGKRRSDDFVIWTLDKSLVILNSCATKYN